MTKRTGQPHVCGYDDCEAKSEALADLDSFALTGEVQAEPSRRIAALATGLARERELRQAAERERDYYRVGYEIALDQWEQCQDGWDAAIADLAGEREKGKAQ